MPTFNPNIPQNGDDADADPLRDNFNALNDQDTAQAQGLASIQALVANQAALIASQDTRITTLEAQLGSLAARIAALEAASVSLTGSGFGEAGACGKLTVIGTFAGKPMYQAAGGWYYCWNEAGGMWICRDALPGTGDLSNNRYADNGYAADIKDVVWGPGFNPGMMPYGTVS